jgi:hypothetical protein
MLLMRRLLATSLFSREVWFSKPGVLARSQFVSWKGAVLIAGGLGVAGFWGACYLILATQYPAVASVFQGLAGISFIGMLLLVFWHTE